MPGYAALTWANTKGDTILQDSRPRFSLFLQCKGNAYAVFEQLALNWQGVEQQVMTSSLTQRARRMQVYVPYHAGVTDVKTHGDGSEGWHS